MAIETNCSPDKCEAHNTEADQDKYKTGACTYEIWNSLSAIHNVSNMRSNSDILAATVGLGSPILLR
jgi:hypothetical protein